MLKDYQQLPASQVAPKKADQQYPTYPGRVVYEQQSITRLNVVPVNIHRDSAVENVSLSQLPPYLRAYDDPARVAEDLLVDGCELAIYENEEWVPQTEIIRASRDVVWQDVTPPDALPGTARYYREFRQLETLDWQVDLYSYPAGAMQPELIEQVTLPFAYVAYQYFPYDLLYKNQWTYWRMEEVKWAIQQETTTFVLSKIIVGELGRNADGALAKLNEGKRIAALPGRNSNVISVGDTTVMDKLMDEYASLKADWYNATYLIDLGDQPNRPVAMDSAIRIAPQRRYRDSLRTAMQRFYSQFSNVSISFNVAPDVLQSGNPSDTESQNV